MEPPPTSRVSGIAAGFLHRLRTLPWLTAAAFVFGVVLSFLETSSAWNALSSRMPEGVTFSGVLQNESLRAEVLEWFQLHWGRATLYLLPAALLAVLRLRHKALILPVAIASLHVTIYWMGTDLLENYHRSLTDPLGMEPSPPAYTFKLVLMGLFLLSPQ